MKFITAAVTVCAVIAVLAGCTPTSSSTVPQLGNSSGAVAGSTSHSGKGSAPLTVHPDKIAAAADCIRSHGVPSYQDPVVDPSGRVYTDARSIQNLTDTQMQALESACGALITAAGFAPGDEAPAPPALVAAGVKAAQCLRANGLPNYRDPTSSTPFTPGHGFGLSADEIPNNGALGKQDPALQRAFKACRDLLDAEIRASGLGALAHG